MQKGALNQAGSLTFLAGGGEMGERIRAFDWESTPLGAPIGWPQSLKTSIRIMLMSRQPVWIGWGPDLIYFYNDPYFSIIGGKHPVALGSPARVVWREIWEVIGPMLATAMGGDEGTYVESQRLIMERNGYPEETYYTFSYSPIPDDEGQPGGIFCANSDDTQRVIGQRELALLRDLASRTAKSPTVQEVNERAMSALESNPWDIPFAALYLVEENGNSACLAGSIGIPEGHELAPYRISLQDKFFRFGLVAERQQPEILDITRYSGTLPGGAWQRAPSYAIALPLPSAGESSRGGVLVCGLNPYRLVGEAYVGFLNLVAGQVAAALSDAEAIERDRKRLAAMAELDRAKTNFFANVSHEFRTPLTLMLSPLDSLVAEDYGTLPDKVRRELVTIRRNGLRLQKLVNTLLDFSRLEAGRMRAAFAPTDFGMYNAELASSFQSAVERASLKFIVDSPPISMESPAYLDQDLWEKLVFNLISNAFKHTFHGSIRVSTRLSGENFVLEVADTGTGISAENLEHLFERFRRIEGAKSRSHEGSGIGLALVREIVELHGGSISVTSVAEGLQTGTTFLVTVPVGSAHLPQDQVSEASGSERLAGQISGGRLGEDFSLDADDDLDTVPDIGAKSLAAASVLVADDNADMRHYIARLLGEAYRLRLVPDGNAALEAIAEEMPDLLITDVMMPHMDGFELLKAIRSDAQISELPVIMLSARAGEESKIEGFESGADDYLVKPFSARELLARVDSALKLAELRRKTSESLRKSQRELESALDEAQTERGRAEGLARELEDKVKARTAELTKTNEQLQGFTYSVAHDLRQQIRRISTNASMILYDDATALTANGRTKLQRMVTGAHQLSDLVDDLLSYAKYGMAVARPEEVDLSAMARETADSLVETGQFKSSVKLSVSPTPAAFVDRSMAQVILENLIENAFKYSQPAENPAIEFGFADGAYFVRDNGVGFDMKYAHKLFLAFERLHSDSSIPGTGIGLANVKRLIDKHDGRIWAEAQPGKGATFRFTLPQVSQEPSPGEAATPKPAADLR